MTRIALLRHGQTEWNRQGRIQGSSDIPLDDTGREQARDAGRRLRDLGVTRVFSSTLGRAAETASLAAAELGLVGPEERLTGLVERAYGAAEGVPGADLALLYPNGVPDAEDESAVVTRTRATMTELADRFPGETLLAATHGGVIGRLLRDLPDSGLTHRNRPRILNGSAWLFDVDGEQIAFLEERSPTVL